MEGNQQGLLELSTGHMFPSERSTTTYEQINPNQKNTYKYI